MSDLTMLLLLLVCGVAVLTAVAAVLAPGRLFRADPPAKPEAKKHRLGRRVGPGAAPR